MYHEGHEEHEEDDGKRCESEQTTKDAKYAKKRTIVSTDSHKLAARFFSLLEAGGDLHEEARGYKEYRPAEEEPVPKIKKGRKKVESLTNKHCFSASAPMLSLAAEPASV